MSTPAYKKRARQIMHAKQKEKREYEKLCASVKTFKREFKPYVPTKPVTRDVPKYPSLTTSDAIPTHCPKRESPKYTGNLIVGIATMHKSNAVPIINKKQAEEIANMRRN